MKTKIIGVIALLMVILIVSCQSDEQVEFNRYYAAGSLTYQTHCQNCHGANGEGLQGLIPPLTDGVYLKNNKSRLACSVRYGLKGGLTIRNRQFEGEMPANDLAPIDVAMVLTYVTNSFGNKLGMMSSDKIQADLEKCN